MKRPIHCPALVLALAAGLLGLPPAFAGDTPGRTGPPRVLAEFDGPVTCLAWSADGRRLAAGGLDGTVHVVEAATGKARAVPTVKGEAITALALAPDGRALAVFDRRLRLSVWDADGDGRWGGTSQFDHEVEHLAFTADGRWVLGAAPNAFVKRQVVRTGPAEGVTRGGRNLVEGGCSAVAPDGAAACSCWPDRPVAVIGVGPADRNNFGDDTGLGVGNARSLALGPGGRLLAVGGDDGVHLWDVPAKRKTRTLTGLGQPAGRLAVSADGRALVAAGADGTAVVAWDLKGHDPRCRIGHARGPVAALALSPDGTRLATAARDGKALLLWTVEARELARGEPRAELSAKDLAAAWDDLSNPNPEAADAAWRRLGAAGDGAVAFLAERVRPIAAGVDPKRLAKLVADLDADRFAARERAVRELEAAGDAAIAPLRRLLERPPSAEARTRAELVLKKLDAGPPPATADELRVLEAIDLLERLRTAPAIALLEEVGRDGNAARLRVEARRALERIGRGPGDRK